MMTAFRHSLVRGMVLLGLLLLAMSSVTAQETASVRFVHAVPGNTPQIDVYINGTQALTNIAYGESSNYLTVPAGEHTVTATERGTENVLWEQTITAAADEAVTYLASSPDDLQFQAIDDNLSATPLGSTRVLLVHAIADAPNVDIRLAEELTLNGTLQDVGTPLAEGMAYTTTVGTFDLPAQTYPVNIIPAGGDTEDRLLATVTLPLNTGTSYMAVVYGTADNPRVMLLSAPTAAGDDSGFVRVAYAAQGNLQPVEVLVNDTSVVPQLSPRQPTAHIAVPAGDHTVTVLAPDSDEPILEGEFSIAAGEAKTLAALVDGAGVVTLEEITDDLSGIDATTAVATVLNTITDSTVTVTLDGETTLAEELGFGEVSETVTFDPTATTVLSEIVLPDASGNVETPTTFYGGVYYNIIILEGGPFNAAGPVIAGTALQQTIESAPDANTLATSGEAVAEADAQVESTAAPTAAAPVESTRPPVSQPLDDTAAESDTVTARILLDPSANLQLRQLPNQDAFSLGLAPSGTVLEVNGREGRPVALVDGQDPPPEAEDYVDPATELDEGEDLDPAETWLNVTYETPDGGEIVAWARAQFLDVRDPDGNLQPLADLPTVGSNVPGEAVETELTPPSETEDRVTGTVINLNAEVNLNVRRTPDTTGEVLARLPRGTVVEIVGFLGSEFIDGQEGIPIETPEDYVLEDIEWAFLRYTPAEGGEITGWSSTLYLNYAFNGRAVDIEELFQRGVVDVLTEDRRGEIGGGAEQAALPTVDPLEDAYVGTVNVNPGANLQFRVSPDATSESLNLIPSGTQLVLDARTPSGDWVQTTFEGESGWVSASFVNVTFNGTPVNISDIPVAEGITPEPESTADADAAAPTATPAATATPQAEATADS